VGENWQVKIEATSNIILPFTTASFQYGTTPFCQPLCGADRLLSEWGERLAAMLSRPPRFAATITWVAFGSDTVLRNHQKFPASRSLHGAYRSPRQLSARCDLARRGQNPRRAAPYGAAGFDCGCCLDRRERYSGAAEEYRNRGQIDTFYCDEDHDLAADVPPNLLLG
jgi:hypothetical protein